MSYEKELAAEFERNGITYPLYYYDEIGSTNDEARKLVEEGAINGRAIIIAERQTAGKGRHGKSFSSQDGGVYLSIAEPCVNILSDNFMTIKAAVVVSGAIESLGIRTRIKWVNDVYVEAGNKKLCGILCESIPRLHYMIIGIGINANNELPVELQGKAVSLKELIGFRINPAELANNVLVQYKKYFYYSKEHILSIYRDKLIFKRARTFNGIEGNIHGVNDDGQLILETKNGIETIISGEVELIEG